MPVIEQSAAWANLSRSRFCDSSSSTDSVWATPLIGDPSASGSSRGELRIYRGTAPDPSVWWANRTTYDADLLIKWRKESSGTGWINYAYVGNSTVVVNSLAPVAALLTGTATWAAWLATADSGVAQYMQAIGTVGVAGSGADVELPSVSIIAGQFYTFSGVTFVFPTSWTY